MSRQKRLEVIYINLIQLRTIDTETVSADLWIPLISKLGFRTRFHWEWEVISQKMNSKGTTNSSILKTYLCYKILHKKWWICRTKPSDGEADNRRIKD